jgi:hypothetical protein
MVSMITPLRDTDRPDGNFLRVVAGGTLSADDIAAGWQRIIKVCLPGDGASAEPAVIELPPARRWAPKEITVVDAASLGYVLRVSAGDKIYGAAAGHVNRPVLRLMPLLSDLHDEPDAWAAT